MPELGYYCLVFSRVPPEGAGGTPGLSRGPRRGPELAEGQLDDIITTIIIRLLKNAGACPVV